MKLNPGVVRNGRHYIVVMGGWSNAKAKHLSSIEFYDVSLQPTSWESGSEISLPTAMGNIKASLVMKLDDNLCDIMLISNTTKRMHICKENYQWSDSDLSAHITKGWGKMAVLDANLF